MSIRYKRVIRIALVVGVILLIPLVLTIRDGGVEGVGWNWTLSDFIFIGSLMFVTGLIIDFAVRKVTHPIYRMLAVALIVLAFFMVWTELAVGAVSQLIAFLMGA